MKVITNSSEIDRLFRLADHMRGSELPGELSTEWVRSKGWTVLPVEDSMHLSLVEIESVVPALIQAGYSTCVAVSSEMYEPTPACYQIQISGEDLKQFNIECGGLRYILVAEDVSWAISCGHWYNLYAGPSELVEAMMGQSIGAARSEFEEYASVLANANPPDHSIQAAAIRYAAL